MGMPIITPSTTTRSQAITDIIESVALEQTALSHILNAEGENIQKNVALTTSTQEMLNVNKSVELMVNSVARLEMVLQSKLELFSDCLCPPTTCAPITNVNITTTAGSTITKVSNTSFSIDLTGATTFTQLFTVVPTPADATIVFTTLPTGVTASGDTFTIDSRVTTEGTIVFTVGSGTCKQTVTVQYSMAV